MGRLHKVINGPPLLHKARLPPFGQRIQSLCDTINNSRLLLPGYGLHNNINDLSLSPLVDRTPYVITLRIIDGSHLDGSHPVLM
jgi:hypothetical protein